jgi:hypothetical protein
MVELGWLQRRIFPHNIIPPRTTLSAHNLLELADDFYRFRTKLWAWPMGEPGYASEVLPGGESEDFWRSITVADRDYTGSSHQKNSRKFCP